MFVCLCCRRPIFLLEYLNMNGLEIVLGIISLFLGALSGHYLYTNSGFKLIWIAILIIPIIYILLYGLWLIIIFIWGKLLNTNKEIKKFSKFFYHIIYVTDSTLLHILNIGIKLINYDKMPKNHDYVLVCNHVSNFDQMVLIACLKKENQPMAWITKPQNMKFPFAGPFVHHAGFIPIDRDNPIEGMKSIKKGVEFLNTHQCAMGICPEGTRNKSEEPLLEFHPGSFKLAMWAKVPIVVVALKNTKSIKKRAPFKHTRVEVNIVDVINPGDYDGKKTIEISSKAREALLNELERK